MRPILHGDVSAAARALLAAPPEGREALCVRMLTEAELAHQHVSATGRLHPVYGNGSIMAVAHSRQLAAEPRFDDLQYCKCFETVLRILIRYHITRRRS